MDMTEETWNAWLLKGRIRERRGNAFRWAAAKWIVGLGALTAAAVYSDRMPYEVAVRSLVAVGVVVAIYKALQPRHPALAKKGG